MPDEPVEDRGFRKIVPLARVQLLTDALFALSMIFGESKPEEETRLAESHNETAIFPLAVPNGAMSFIPSMPIARSARKSTTIKILTSLALVATGVVLAVTDRAVHAVRGVRALAPVGDDPRRHLRVALDAVLVRLGHDGLGVGDHPVNADGNQTVGDDLQHDAGVDDDVVVRRNRIDPVALHLGADRPVAERGRALRSGQQRRRWPRSRSAAGRPGYRLRGGAVVRRGQARDARFPGESAHFYRRLRLCH